MTMPRHTKSFRRLTALLGTLCLVASAELWSLEGQEPAKEPVPSSPYLSLVYRYADVMLEKGRDALGPVKSLLLLSSLDRGTLEPLSKRPVAPAGIREGDRAGPATGPLTGANPQHDQNLLRLLYTLSELSSKAKYREAADAELKWFLENTQSPETRLLPWGEHLSWNAALDAPTSVSDGDAGTHEFFRPWLLWDRCFDVAPASSASFALGLWEHQIADPSTGAFDRHAGFSKHAPRDGMDFPRHAGFYIRTWAVAHARTRDERFLKAIETLLERFEKKRDPTTGLIPAYSGHADAWVASTLSLAIDCEGAAHRVPEPLRSRLRDFAAREDKVFCGLPHPVRQRGGFWTVLGAKAANPTDEPTAPWTGRYGSYSTAQVGMMCVSRYENTGKLAYRELVHAAADVYLTASPADGADVWPVTFGLAISLELAAWRSTAKPVYLNRARELADRALKTFFGENALPRASARTEHYETITGADTLALALVELHLHILYITAVRCPPNTADR